MCMGMMGRGPQGVPIPDEIHEMYSENLKNAWAIFDTW